MELGVRIGSVVGDGLGGIGEGERCIARDGFGLCLDGGNDLARMCSREKRLALY